MIYHSTLGYTLGFDGLDMPFVVKTLDFKRDYEQHLKDEERGLHSLNELKWDVEKYVHKQDWSYKEQQDYLNYTVGVFINFSVKMAEKRIENLKKILKDIPVKGKKKMTGTGNIQEAKKVPISNFIEFNRAGFAVCPFHSEKTGSLKYYKDKNKAHCFGSCGKSFDVIDIVQNLNQCSLPQAIKILTA